MSRAHPWARRVATGLSWVFGVSAVLLTVTALDFGRPLRTLANGVLFSLWVGLPWWVAWRIARRPERTGVTLGLLALVIAAGGGWSIWTFLDELHLDPHAWSGMVAMVFPLWQLTVLAGVWVVMLLIELIGVRRDARTPGTARR